MTDYTKLVEALRCCGDVGCHKCPYQKHIHEHFCWTMAMHDAADAIEKLVALYEKAEMDATNLTGKLAQAEAQLTDYAAAIEELKEKPWVESVQIDKLRQRIDELEEKQTYCDAYGDKWMTSGKDVPTEAYKHGYADGRDEAEAQLPKHGKWVEDTTTYAGPGLSNYKCSLCGKICGTWRSGLKPSELPNWCGNCGAKMEVQE